MMKNGTLTARQTRAIELLLTGKPIKEVADSLNVSRGTVYRWLEQPKFNAVVNHEKSLIVERLSLALANLGQKAVDTLKEALDDPSAGTSVRVRAADIVISRMLVFADQVELSARIANLETYVNERRK